MCDRILLDIFLLNFTSLKFDMRSDDNIFSIQKGDNSSNNIFFSIASLETMTQT